MFASSITRPVQLVSRVMQWASAVIVMGITSYFIHKGPVGLSLKYQEIIVRLPLFPLKRTTSLTRSDTGHHVGRVLPSGFRLALHAHRTRQGRHLHRRDLLLPVRLHPMNTDNTTPRQSCIYTNV